jgi:hypothetical protein
VRRAGSWAKGLSETQQRKDSLTSYGANFLFVLSTVLYFISLFSLFGFAFPPHNTACWDKEKTFRTIRYENCLDRPGEGGGLTLEVEVPAYILLGADLDCGTMTLTASFHRAAS